jgi:hypothetical protein
LHFAGLVAALPHYAGRVVWPLFRQGGSITALWQAGWQLWAFAGRVAAMGLCRQGGSLALCRPGALPTLLVAALPRYAGRVLWRFCRRGSSLAALCRQGGGAAGLHFAGPVVALPHYAGRAAAMAILPTLALLHWLLSVPWPLSVGCGALLPRHSYARR